jgi:hypothetical protein
MVPITLHIYSEKNSSVHQGFVLYPFVLRLLLQDPLPIYSTSYLHPLTLDLMLFGWFYFQLFLFFLWEYHI